MTPPPDLTAVQAYYVALLNDALTVAVIFAGLVLVVLGSLWVRGWRS